MKTVFKTMVLAAVMAAGVQANAAMVTCSVASEQEAGDYSKLEFATTREVADDGSNVLLSTDDGFPVEIRGLSFSVARSDYGMFIYASQLNKRTIIAGAAARDGKEVLLVLPSQKLSIVCTEATR